MKCSAEAYVCPSTVNADGHHWLKQPFPTPPPGGGWWPQNVRYFG